MKEQRFFYVPDAAHTMMLPAEEAAHAVRVLRLHEGDEVFLLDGVGAVHRANLVAASQKQCVYSITETLTPLRTWRGHVTLAIAPTKMMDRMEWLAEKATEIGFDALVPLLCHWSERRQLRTDRLDKIVVGAMKQSRKAWKPRVDDMTAFRQFIAACQTGYRFIAHCHDGCERTDLFQLLTQIPQTEQPEVTILIGPEGDFSLEEVQMAVEAGFIPVSLGSSRLRTETAGLAAVMMANLALRI